MFGNALKVGDYVCFTLGHCDYKQTPHLVSAKVVGFISGKAEWVMVDEYRNLPANATAIKKVSACRVIKCY